MGLPEFQLLCHDLNISDPSSKGCKPADLDNIFISTNIEDATRGTSSKEQKAAQQHTRTLAPTPAPASTPPPAPTPTPPPTPAPTVAPTPTLARSVPQALNTANFDKALMRFEFLQAIVRLAIARHGAKYGGDEGDASEAVERLLDQVRGRGRGRVRGKGS